MFQVFVMVLVVSVGRVQGGLHEGSSFSSYEECSRALPERLADIRKTTPESPDLIVTVGCVKTGEHASI